MDKRQKQELVCCNAFVVDVKTLPNLSARKTEDDKKKDDKRKKQNGQKEKGRSPKVK